MANDHGNVDRRRRMLLGAGVGGCVGAALGTRVETVAAASTVKPGDVLVHSGADNQGEAVDPKALSPLEAVLTRPRSSAGKVRQGKNNLITVVRVPAGELDPRFADVAAGDVVAVSAVCTHQGCLVSGVGHFGTAEGKLACSCHGSVFDPRVGGKNVEGPAPRGLPALPIDQKDGQLVVTGEFTGKVGPS